MQLHDFNDLQVFPSRLRSLTLCLSENIFLEGFLRKVYTFISSVEILHIVGNNISLVHSAENPSYPNLGTYEKVEDEEEEVYETVNVFKLKQYLPNLRIVNLWGVSLSSLGALVYNQVRRSRTSRMTMWTLCRRIVPTCSV
jgi:hypothetical protein